MIKDSKGDNPSLYGRSIMNRTGLYFAAAVTMAALIGVISLPIPSFTYEISWSIFNRDSEYFEEIQSNPRRLVQEYCESEFNGVQDIRVKVAKFTPKRTSGDKNASSENDDSARKVINFYSEPLVVVDSYQVRKVNASGDRAEATVVYKRLANSSGIDGRKYTVDKISQDVVTLTLEYDGSRWWITDPPLPRVSKWSLIEYSERIISSMDDLIRAGRASEGQKKYYVNNRNIVIFLRSL